MPAAATASSSLCIVALHKPNSTTGHKRERKRASDVPPLVDSSGSRPVACVIAAAIMSENSPGGVRNGSPLIFASNSPPSDRSEEHTSELQSLMRNPYAVY